MRKEQLSNLPQYNGSVPRTDLKAVESARLLLRSGDSKLVYVAAVVNPLKNRLPQRHILVSDSIDSKGNISPLVAREPDGANGYDAVFISDIRRYLDRRALK